MVKLKLVWIQMNLDNRLLRMNYSRECWVLEYRCQISNIPERMLQDGGHYGKLSGHQPRMEEHFEDFEGDERYINLHKQELKENKKTKFMEI